MKFGSRVRLKPSSDQGKFELDRAKSKNNIAENLVALGHETDDRHNAPLTPSALVLLHESAINLAVIWFCAFNIISTSFSACFLCLTTL